MIALIKIANFSHSHNIVVMWYDTLLKFLITTSKLKNFNKNYKGLGTTEKEKKQEETQTGQ